MWDDDPQREHGQYTKNGQDLDPEMRVVNNRGLTMPTLTTALPRIPPPSQSHRPPSEERSRLPQEPPMYAQSRGPRPRTESTFREPAPSQPPQTTVLETIAPERTVIETTIRERTAIEATVLETIVLGRTTIAATVIEAIVQKRTATNKTSPFPREIPSQEAPPTARAAGLHPQLPPPHTGLQIPVVMLPHAPRSGQPLVGFPISLYTGLLAHPVLHRSPSRAVRVEQGRDRRVLVGSSGVGPLLRAAVVGGRWLGFFSGVSGKGGGGFFAWALKDIPAPFHV